jgi:hypothetical protein
MSEEPPNFPRPEDAADLSSREAIWHASTGDIPIKIIGSYGFREGVEYLKMEGSGTGVPANQIEFMTKKAERSGSESWLAIYRGKEVVVVDNVIEKKKNYAVLSTGEKVPDNDELQYIRKIETLSAPVETPGPEPLKSLAHEPVVHAPSPEPVSAEVAGSPPHIILRHPDMGEIPVSMANGQLQEDSPVDPELQAARRFASTELGGIATEEVVKPQDEDVYPMELIYKRALEVGILKPNGEVDPGWRIEKADRRRSGDIYVELIKDGEAPRFIHENNIVLPRDGPLDKRELPNLRIGEKYATKYFPTTPIFEVIDIVPSATGEDEANQVVLNYLQSDGKVVQENIKISLKEFDERGRKAGWHQVDSPTELEPPAPIEPEPAPTLELELEPDTVEGAKFKNGQSVWFLNEETGKYEKKMAEKVFRGKWGVVWVRVVDPKNPEWRPRRMAEDHLEVWQAPGEQQALEDAENAVNELGREAFWARAPEFHKGMRVKAKDDEGKMRDSFIVIDCGNRADVPGVLFMAIKNTETDEEFNISYDRLKEWQGLDFHRDPDKFGYIFKPGDAVKVAVEGNLEDDWHVISSVKNRDNEVSVKVMRSSGGSKIMYIPQDRLQRWQNSETEGALGADEIRPGTWAKWTEVEPGKWEELEPFKFFEYNTSKFRPDLAPERANMDEALLRSALDKFISSSEAKSQEGWEAFVSKRTGQLMKGLVLPAKGAGFVGWAVAERPTKFLHNKVVAPIIKKGSGSKNKWGNRFSKIENNAESVDTYGITYGLSKEELQALMAQAMATRSGNSGKLSPAARSEFNRLKKERLTLFNGLNSTEINELRLKARTEVESDTSIKETKKTLETEVKFYELVKSAQKEKGIDARNLNSDLNAYRKKIIRRTLGATVVLSLFV